MDPLLGQSLLNRYRIEAFVVRGGMSDVYKAFDIQRNTFVAIKLLREDLAQDLVFRRKFRREATVLQTLNHPNIVRFYSFEEESLLAFLVLQFIEGPPLRALIAAREGDPFSPEEALAYLEPVCSALQYGHSEGVYHCDVKPGNILIEERTGRVLVSDFGIAKLAESATVTTSTPGTPAYMSPEQCRGQGVDQRTDVYSLAITLYEMVTGGERPFIGDRAPGEGSTGEKIRWEHITAEPPSPRPHNPELPVQAEQVILKALAKNPDDRYGSVTDFVAAYRDALGEEVMVPPIKPVGPSPPPEPPKTRAWYAALGGFGATGVIILLVVVCIGGILLIPRALSPNPAPTATQPPWTATGSSLTATTDNTPLTPTSTLTDFVQPTDTIAVPSSTYTPTPVPPTSTCTAAPKETPTLAQVPPTPTTEPIPPTPAGPVSGRIFFAVGEERVLAAFGGSHAPTHMLNPEGESSDFPRGVMPDVSADGSALLFAVTTDCGWGPGGAGTPDAGLYVLGLDSRQSKLVASGCYDYPALSPDLATIAYSSGGTIYVWENGRPRNLTEGDYPDWSPDGARIAYLDDNSVYKIPAAGGSPVRLAEAQTWRWGGRGDCRISWSPDGSSIAYTYSEDIWIVSASGADRQQLTTHSACDYSPAWSPDSSRIVFVSERDGNQELYVIDVGNGTATRLTSTPDRQEIHPTWSR